MRMPKGVSPASGRPAAGLPPCSQQKMKVLSVGGGVKTEFFSSGLSSPLMNTVPAGYFTQICNTTAAEQRANSLYSTPHGPEAKPIRSSSGRLPVRESNTHHTHTHTHTFTTVTKCLDFHWYACITVATFKICFDVISHSGATVAKAVAAAVCVCVCVCVCV